MQDIRVQVVLALALLIGCGSIKHHAESQQPMGVVLSAVPGQALLIIDKSHDMPNAFGGADIYGRRVKEGTIELRFISMDNNLVKLSYNETNISSNETTLSHGKITTVTGGSHTSVDATKSEYGNNSRVEGNAQTTTNATITEFGGQPITVTTLPGSHEVFSLDYSEHKEIFLNEYRIRILDVSPSGIKYIINKIRH